MAANSQINPGVFTTTQNSSGQSVFTEVERKAFSSNLVVIYGSNSLPVDISDDADLHYHSTSPIELVPKDGCQVFLFRIQPGGKNAPVTRLHRNLSIDIGVMIAGSVEAVLGSGEARTLVVGDSLIQRAATHGWRNTSEDTAAAMIIVAVPAKE